MDEISLSQNEFKALASKSRTNILKLLQERNYTLSELAAKTNMTAPTVKQHTSILVETGLIELKDEGRKWKYYSLTKKGKQILESKENKTNIFIVLGSIGFVALLGLAIIFSGSFLPTNLEASTSMDSIVNRTSIAAAPESDVELTTIIAGDNAEAAEVRCEPTFEVLHNEAPNVGITASEAYSQDCYNAPNQEICEKVDVYSKETETFGDQDGIPDCEWKIAEFDK